MPEYPDVELYVEHLNRRLATARLERVLVTGINLLRTVDPALSKAHGRQVQNVRRMGKRIVFDLDGDLHLAIHLMIAGRFRWRKTGTKVPRKNGLAAFEFTPGQLLLTEAGTRQRASLHLMRGETALRTLDRGGLEVMDSSPQAFHAALVSEDHTLKRALTDPRLFSGIGNAYSDEILHRARLSPLRRTSQLDNQEVARLHDATVRTLAGWLERLREEAGEAFPNKVTAFREGMAVHGRYGQHCPECGTPVQRIIYAVNETNYCARCQTQGRVLADRSLSRLLKSDWPKTIEELEGER